MADRPKRLRPTRRHFVVTGDGDFPFDMLRYDECWPVDIESAMAMRTDSEPTPQHRRVLHLASDLEGAPNVARWKSQGWTVQVVEYLKS